MKVNILFNGKYPGYSAGANRIRLYQKGLRELGNDVRIYSIEINLGKKIKRLLRPVFQIKYILNLFRKNNFDNSIIVLYGMGWLLVLFTRLITKYKNIKIIIELNEKPYEPYKNRILNNKFIKSTNKFLYEQFVINSNLPFIVISRKLNEYLINKGCDSNKILKIPIIIDPFEYAYNKNDIEVQRPYLLHSGSLNEQKDGIIGIIEAFSLVNKKLNNKLHFYYTDESGPLTIKEKITEIVQKNDLKDNIHYLGILEREDLINYQKNCSMMILNKPCNVQNIFNFSTKLGEYLALEIPIVFTPVGEIKYFLKDRVNAYMFSSNQPEELAELIIEILMDKGQNVKTISVNGKKLTDNEFNYYGHCQRLSDFMEKL